MTRSHSHLRLVPLTPEEKTAERLKHIPRIKLVPMVATSAKAQEPVKLTAEQRERYNAAFLKCLAVHCYFAELPGALS